MWKGIASQSGGDFAMSNAQQSSLQMSLESLIYWANGWGADISLAGLAIASSLGDFADIRLLCKAVQKAEKHSGRVDSANSIKSIHDAVKAMGKALSQRFASDGTQLGFGHLPASLSHPDAESLIQKGDNETVIDFLRGLHLCYGKAASPPPSPSTPAATGVTEQRREHDPFRNAPDDLRKVPFFAFATFCS